MKTSGIDRAVIVIVHEGTEWSYCEVWTERGCELVTRGKSGLAEARSYCRDFGLRYRIA